MDATLAKKQVEIAPVISDYDKTLQRHIGEMLGFYARFSYYSVDFTVIGRVVHVSGTVISKLEQHCLRETLARIKGVHAVWDIVQVSREGPPRIIEIGCGRIKQYSQALGVDRYPCEGADAVADFEKGLPFADNTADHVFAIHILEHVHDLTGLMNEIHRVIKPSGVLHLVVPNIIGRNAAASPRQPAHIRCFNRKTLEYFCRPRHGTLPFRPICVSEDTASIYADLVPVKEGTDCIRENELAYYFDER